MKTSIQDFSKEVQTLWSDLQAQIKEGKTDGLLEGFSGMDNSEEKLYDFLKESGYDLSVGEFKEFLGFCKAYIEENKETYAKLFTESESCELSEEELESVAGGINLGKLAKSGAIGALTGAATGGVGGMLIGAKAGIVLGAPATPVGMLVAAGLGAAAGAALGGAGGAAIGGTAGVAKEVVEQEF